MLFIVGCPPTATEPDKPQPIKQQQQQQQQPDIEPNEPQLTPAAAFHEKCAPILKEFVNDNGMVDYKILRRNKPQLNALLDKFARLSPEEYNSWPREDKIAFWINAYNIQMLKTILYNYPIQASRIRLVFWPPNSIRHIHGIQTKYKFIVMDEQFTLLEIEKRFLDKEFNEPRAYLAISQASLSSPTLRNEPYYGHSLEEQLDSQAEKFLSRDDSFRIDRQKQKVYVSAIFNPNWYGQRFDSKYGTDKKFKDMESTTRAVLNFISNYIPENNKNFLETANYSVEYIKYNWILNE